MNPTILSGFLLGLIITDSDNFISHCTLPLRLP